MWQISASSLDQVLSLQPLTVTPETPLPEAIGQMGRPSIHDHFPSKEGTDPNPPSLAEQHPSYVLVLDDSQLVGILTQRDIVRLLAEYRSLTELTVADVMSQQVITLKAEDNPDIFSVLDLMRYHQIHHLPVVDDQEKVLGVLTPRRLCSLLEPADLLKLRQVHEVMTSTFIHAVPTDPVQQITQMMAAHQVSCVVIVETLAGSTNQLYPIGIITERDIVQCQQQELNLERTQAQDVMSRPLFLIAPEDSLWTAHQRMEHYKLRHLAVADLEGRLQGIIIQSHLLPKDQNEINEVLELLQQQVQDLQAEYVKLQQERTDDLVQKANTHMGLRQHLHSELQDANQRLTFHVENSPLAVVEWDSQFRVQRWSQQAENIFGWSASEVLGKHWTDWVFVFEADLEAVMEITSDLLKGQEPRNISHNRNYTKAGLVIDCEWYNSALLDGSGNLISILSLAQDVTARKQLEDIQQVSEERLQLALEGSGNGLWDWDITTGTVYLSPRWLAMLGYEENEIPGHVSTWDNLIHPEDKSWVMELREAHLQDGEIPYTFDYRMRTQAGEWKWIANYGKVVVRDHDGSPLRMSGTHKDISERKQSEVALKESEERFRYLADHAPVLIWIAGYDKRCFHFNKHWLDFTGRTIEQELNNGWAEGVHPDDLKFCLDTYNYSFDARQAFEMEYRLRRFDGEYRWILDKGVPRFDPNNEFLGYIGSCIDISDRKQTEKLLQNSEQRCRSITDVVQHMVWVANAEGLSYDFNEQCQAYLGMTVEDIRGYGWIDAVHPDDTEQALTQWQKSLQNTTPFDAKYRIRRSDGVYRWHIVRGIPRIIDGQIQEWIGSCTDIEDLMQTEAALRESEERQDLALDAGWMGVWDWHLPTNQIIWSGHHNELFGLAPDGFDGSFDAFINYVHKEDHALIFEAMESSQQNHTPYEADFRVIWPDGSLHYMSARGKFYYSADGEPLRMLGMVMDISDRKQTEIVLRQQALIFKSITDGVILTDLEGCILDWNPAAEQIFGYTKAEVLGQTSGLLHRPEEAATLMPQILDGMAREGQWSGEITFVCKDGTIGICETVVVPLLDQKGQVVATIGLNHDITERRKAEKQIHEQAALLNITTDAMIVRSLEHKILFWNQGAERLYGWQAKDVLGRNVKDLLYPEPLAQLENIQNSLRENGTWQGELQQVTHSGQEIVVDSRWTLMQDENRQPSSILVVNTDITEKKQLEAQYLRAQRLESIGTLAGGIAHDLNNILTPIIGIAGLLPLKIPHLDEQSQHLIEMLQSSAHRGADLVQQVLSFSRGIENKRITMQVGHLLSEVKDFAEKTFPKNIELHINLPSDLGFVSVDATQLHQMLMNLCVNARDAMPHGGTLSFSAENFLIDENYAQMRLEAQVGPYIVLSVADTGVGMAPETLERIFDPFFTTKEVGSGTGLGLSTLLGIVKNHGGFVTVDSQLGSGTQFSVYLPTVEDTSTAQTEVLEHVHGQGELILVVDDEAPIREITKATLEAYKYKVITAQTGIEAIAQYVQYQDDIDAVLMDMMMPEMGGTKAIQTLKALDPQVKIIIATGLASRKQNTTDTDLKVDAFLSKPYTAEMLLNALKGVFNHTP